MGLERKSKQVLQQEYECKGSGVVIFQHTFLDSVLAEMSTPNSRLAVYFKELEKIVREVGAANFEKLSEEASKKLLEINKYAHIASLAIEMFKRATNVDLNYDIYINGDKIALTIGDEEYRFQPQMFNYDTVRFVLQQKLDEINKRLSILGAEDYRLFSKLDATERKSLPSLRRLSQSYKKTQRDFNIGSKRMEQLRKEASPLKVICDPDSEYAFILYEAFNAILREYECRRALSYLNRKGNVYINESYSVEDMEQALNGLSERLAGIDYDAPNEVFPTIEEKGIKGEYDFKEELPEDIEKLRKLVEWFIDSVYAREHSEELTDGVSLKRTKKDNN